MFRGRPIYTYTVFLQAVPCRLSPAFEYVVVGMAKLVGSGMLVNKRPEFEQRRSWTFSVSLMFKHLKNHGVVKNNGNSWKIS